MLLVHNNSVHRTALAVFTLRFVYEISTLWRILEVTHFVYTRTIPPSSSSLLYVFTAVIYWKFCHGNRCWNYVHLWIRAKVPVYILYLSYELKKKWLRATPDRTEDIIKLDLSQILLLIRWEYNLITSIRKGFDLVEQTLLQ